MAFILASGLILRTRLTTIVMSHRFGFYSNISKRSCSKKEVLKKNDVKKVFVLYIVLIDTDIQAIDSVGDPPLPIPNREVKPNSADGTANVCGRVGHRHFL